MSSMLVIGKFWGRHIQWIGMGYTMTSDSEADAHGRDD